MSIIAGSNNPSGETAGLTDILLMVARDPEGFDEKVSAYREAATAAEEQIKLLGLAGDIPKMHDQARADVDEATRLKITASAEADKIVAEAQEAAAEIIRLAEDERKSIEAQTAVLEKGIADLNTLASTTRKELAKDIEAHNAKIVEDKAAIEAERIRLHDALARAGATENAALKLKTAILQKFDRVKAVILE